ncbi:MAG: ion channel, partial [Gammaproteobacteria bacterium]
MKHQLHVYAGLAGVSNHEPERAQRWGRYFEWPLVGIALWIPVIWYFEVAQHMTSVLVVISDWLIWLVFVIETVVLTALVRDKRHYLLTNWMNLVIIAAGLPILWNYAPLAIALRSFRLLLVVGVAFSLSRTMRKLLARNKLGYTLIVAGIVMVISGLIIASVDPAFHSPGEGIWWALVTMSTVGYGDVVPTTTAGKVFAGFLILLGLGFFSLLTASISAFMVDREMEEGDKELK